MANTMQLKQSPTYDQASSYVRPVTGEDYGMVYTPLVPETGDSQLQVRQQLGRNSMRPALIKAGLGAGIGLGGSIGQAIGGRTGGYVGAGLGTLLGIAGGYWGGGKLGDKYGEQYNTLMNQRALANQQARNQYVTGSNEVYNQGRENYNTRQENNETAQTGGILRNPGLPQGVPLSAAGDFQAAGKPGMDAAAQQFINWKASNEGDQIRQQTPHFMQSQPGQPPTGQPQPGQQPGQPQVPPRPGQMQNPAGMDLSDQPLQAGAKQQSVPDMPTLMQLAQSAQGSMTPEQRNAATSEGRQQYQLPSQIANTNAQTQNYQSQTHYNDSRSAEVNAKLPFARALIQSEIAKNYGQASAAKNRNEIEQMAGYVAAGNLTDADAIKILNGSKLTEPTTVDYFNDGIDKSKAKLAPDGKHYIYQGRVLIPNRDYQQLHIGKSSSQQQAAMEALLAKLGGNSN